MGHIEILRDFYSYPEGCMRTLRVYTPEAYDAERERRFPVLYVQDGQHVFSHPQSATFHTWCANVTLERLVAQGQIEPWIVVAIDHGPGRLEDYSPWPEPRLGLAGRGQAYAKFLVDHLKPFVDRAYRTLYHPETTAVMGASVGGLISLYLVHTYPQVFGRVAALSPSVMWAERGLYAYWRHHPRCFSKIYLDAGTEETVNWAGLLLDYGSETPAFYQHLRQLGYADHELRLVLEPGAAHHELDWQRRLPGALAWLLS